MKKQHSQFEPELQEKRRLKVGFVSQPWDNFCYPAESGSISIWISNVISGLKDEFDFIVYSKRKRGQLAREISDGVLCRRFSTAVDLFLHKFLRRLWFGDGDDLPFCATPAYHFLYCLRVAMDLRRNRVDVVHVMNFSQFVDVIRWFNPHIKIVLHMHCEWLTQWRQSVIEKRLSAVDLVVGCSEFVTDQVRQRFASVAERCKTVFNGVDVGRFNCSCDAGKVDAEKRLLFVGRLSPEKGVHVLIDAFGLVAESYPNVKLVIAGPAGAAPFDFLVRVSKDKMVRDLERFYTDDYGRELRTQIKSKLSDATARRISFEGFVNHGDLVQYYREADIVVNSSLWESFGRSLIEAMACGKAIVASDIGGIGEIVEDGRSGVLVRADDAGALADGILRLLEADDLRERMGAYGFDRVRSRFGWDVVVAEMMLEYLAMVNVARMRRVVDCY